MNRCFWIVLAVLAAGCHRVSIYELPPPPPEEERRDVSLIPGEESRREEQRYLEARAAAIEIYNLLSTRRYEEAVSRMSAETRDFLRGTGKKPAAEVLAAGKLTLPDGTTTTFDPTTLVAADVSKLSDAISGLEEQETAQRKELFATLPSGEIQKIVLITERGQWVLHRTRLPEPFTPPK